MIFAVDGIREYGVSCSRKMVDCFVECMVHIVYRGIRMAMFTKRR